MGLFGFLSVNATIYILLALVIIMGVALTAVGAAFWNWSRQIEPYTRDVRAINWTNASMTIGMIVVAIVGGLLVVA